MKREEEREEEGWSGYRYNSDSVEQVCPFCATCSEYV